MDEFHAIICGTSLLSNFANKRRDEAEKLGITDWFRLDPDDARQIDAEKSAYKGNPIFDKLYEFLLKEPKRASAELNSFLRFCELYHAEREALLYCTDTGTGWLTAYIIYNYLKEHSNTRMVGEPVKLRYFRSSETFDEGLIDIIENISKIITSKKEQGYKVYINATGGFKPESTFAVIGAFLAGADSVYYRFESFRDLIRLPAIPLRLDVERYKIIDELREDKSIESLIDKGFNKAYLDELDSLGIISIDGMKVRLREWIKKLISIRNG